MAPTRTDDALDKDITQLLMQNPSGLTIGDITTAAKCTPTAARNALARLKVDKGAGGMLYILRRAGDSVPKEQGEMTAAEIANTLYKPGDKITIVSVKPEYVADKRALMGTVQTVESVAQHGGYPIRTRRYETARWRWELHEIRHATTDEIAAAAARNSGVK